MNSPSRFFNAYHQGYIRLGACRHHTHLGDPQANVTEILELLTLPAHHSVGIAVFPELNLCGYSLEDIFLQECLHHQIHQALTRLVIASHDLFPLIIVGAPLQYRHRLYNCAIVIHRGHILGVVPKTYLPTYGEFYESRYFASGANQSGYIILADQRVPFGPDLLVRIGDLHNCIIQIEICEDMFVPITPASYGALAGATIIVNLSGSPITIGRAHDRALLAQSHSQRLCAAYLYTAAGQGESTTDLAWDGQAMIWENGTLLTQGQRFSSQSQCLIADVDLDRLAACRRKITTFNDNAQHYPAEFRLVETTLNPPTGDLGLQRHVLRFPFVPHDPTRLHQDCHEAYHIQIAGLAQRLSSLGHPKIILGISGGLDSTQALLVAAKTLDTLNRPRTDILAYTMPGFATSTRTKHQALSLAKALGITAHELDIRPIASHMLTTLEHPYANGQPCYDVTFENVQAGLRTDYLFRLANTHHGIVLGTGDLSELALGWSTYGVGDHMSHYNINAGIPKTLIQYLIAWIRDTHEFPTPVGDILTDILTSEISPELVPTHTDQPQSTQAIIGPYDLHDFILYYVLRYGYHPEKIAFLAYHAWGHDHHDNWPYHYPPSDYHNYTLSEICHWLTIFAQRFYATSQFKRSAVPNGPKVCPAGSLSPRADWRAPSDLSAHIWIEAINNIPTTDSHPHTL